MSYNYFKTYFFHEVVIQVLLYFFPKLHHCPIKNPLNLVIFPLTDFPTVAKSLITLVIITSGRIFDCVKVIPALCHLSREELPLQSSAALPDCEYRYCWIRLKHACPNL